MALHAISPKRGILTSIDSDSHHFLVDFADEMRIIHTSFSLRLRKFAATSLVTQFLQELTLFSLIKYAKTSEVWVVLSS